MADHGTAKKREETEEVLHELRAELRRLLTEADRLTSPVQIDPERGVDFREEVANHQRNLIVEALRLAKGKQNRAARLLNLSPSTLHLKMRTLNIDPKNF